MSSDLDEYLSKDALKQSERDLDIIISHIRSHRSVPYKAKAKATVAPVVLPPQLEAIVSPPKPPLHRRF